jgi:putative glutamine amidotransferase
VINVAAGGCIIQHLAAGGHDQKEPRHYATHPVTLAADSCLAEIYAGAQIMTNSFHHQALGRLGAEMRSAGTAADGVTEAVERTSGSWCLGVQWHPECLRDEGTKRLFAYFIQQAAGRPPLLGEENQNHDGFNQR